MLTAMAIGSPPRTTPSPPVLLDGPTSVATKTKFIPPLHIMELDELSFSVLGRVFSPGLTFCIDSQSPICAQFVIFSDPKDLPPLTLELLDTKCEAVTVAIG
ncbi:hypothetical protein U1Q18_019883 [Sarracenia purpurea var. burkii]